VTELTDVDGVLVGFRIPAWAGSVNLAGLHLHFLTADRTRGGHVLSFEVAPAAVALDFCRSVDVQVPDTAGFRRVNLTPPNNAELDRVEKPAGK
jgi:acetolactate decarboxylase